MTASHDELWRQCRVDAVLEREGVIDAEFSRLHRCRAAWRLVRIYRNPWREAALAAAVDRLGADAATARWLITPLAAGQEVSPIELIETEDGADRLRDLLRTRPFG